MNTLVIIVVAIVITTITNGLVASSIVRQDADIRPSLSRNTTGAWGILSATNKYPKILLKSGIQKGKSNRHALLYLATLLLLHDTELNPGPKSKTPKHPCGNCNKTVTWENKGVCCDGCDKWYHTVCQNMGDNIYECIGKSDISWICTQCGLPNWSSSFFTMFNQQPNLTGNRYYYISPEPGADEPHTGKLDQGSSPSLFTVSTPSCENSSGGDIGSPGIPLASSSPKVSPKRGKNLKINKTPIMLKLLNVNCRSIVNKKDTFQNLVDSTSPDIIIATETWLTDDIKDGEIGQANNFSERYSIYRQDRTTRNGGVMIAVRANIKSLRETELETGGEQVWVKVEIKGTRALLVGGYYRPHVSDIEGLEYFGTSAYRACQYSNANVWISGDFNLPGIDWELNTVKPGSTHVDIQEKFIQYLHDYGLQQMVRDPTREGTILDLFLTNNKTLINKVQTIPGISDHDCVLVTGNLSPITHKQSRREIPLYSKANWEGLGKYIKGAWSNQGKIGKTSNQLWESFRLILDKGIKEFIPHKVARTKNSLPWISTELRRLLRKQEKLYCRMKKETTASTTKAFKELKQVTQRKLRRAYWDHVEKVITPEGGEHEGKGSKKFWSYIKHCKRDSTGIAPLVNKEGHLESSPEGKAELLNNQFCSVFSKAVPLSLAQICKKHLNVSDSAPEMATPQISLEGVEKLLKNLNPNKASGPDQVSPKILKELHAVIAPILQTIFQSSLSTGEVPKEWKDANVAPIYKKGPKHIAANYRPVSLTCICSKLMEHIIASQVMSYLSEHNILSDRQHGFRAKRSCETQLLGFIQDLQSKADKGTQTDAVVLDFSKAFDKVAHNKLIYKLGKYGIRGQTLKWIEEWLHNRKQQVVVDGKKSSSSGVTSGVPQGSVLGPILFLVYINDLPSSVKSETRLFADDTILYRHINNINDQQQLQEDLNNLERWEKEWDMEFHPGKCQVVQFSRSKKPREKDYTLHGQTLERASTCKYLGVNITSDMTWGNHISKAVSKANRIQGFLKRNLQISNSKIKERAYLGLVRPHVEYCATVWDPHEKKYVYNIEMVQRRAARWVLNRHHNTSSVTEMLGSLGWKSLQHRRYDTRVSMLFKMVSGVVAVNPYQYAQPVTRVTRNTHAFSFVPLQARTVAYHQSFFPRTIVQWNALPPLFVEATNIDSFRLHLASQCVSAIPHLI